MFKLQESYYKDIQKDLESYLFETFYKPFMALIKEPIYNSRNDVVNAINNGTIAYKDGQFTGKFNIRISKTLQKFATFDSRSKTYKVKSPGLMPPDIKMAIVAKDSKDQALLKQTNELFNNLEQRFNDGVDPKIKTSIGKTIDEIESKFQKDVSPLGVQMKLTPDMKKNLVEQYNNNQDLNIKNWNFEQVQRLRNMITKVNERGFSKETLQSLLQREWGVSKNKAAFLARQETSLFLSKFRREQSLNAGIRYYKWSTSLDERVRPSDISELKAGANHRRLHGKVFAYGDPPIVNTKTGARAEPGEDFNCRCVAIPLVGVA